MSQRLHASIEETPLPDVAATATSGRHFATALLVLTVAPLLFFGLLAGPLRDNAAVIPMANAMWFAGVVHVGITGLLWFDGRYRRHMRRRPGFFYVGPAVLTVCCVVGVEATGAAGYQAFTTLATGWLLYHFGRQNWGMLCLVAAALGDARPSSTERRICQWAPVCGIAGALIGAGASGWPGAARLIGLSVGAMVAGASIVVASRQASAAAHPVRVAMTIVVGWFFLPIYLFGSNGLPFGSYGLVAVSVAHSYQYVFVMICMAQGSGRWSLLPLAGISAVYLAGYYLMILLDRGSWSRPLAVFWYAIILWHFIIDAEVWRLSRPFQRRTLRDSLPFVFRTAND